MCCQKHLVGHCLDAGLIWQGSSCVLYPWPVQKGISMMRAFWDKIPKQFLAFAADATVVPLRGLGSCDIMWVRLLP